MCTFLYLYFLTFKTTLLLTCILFILLSGTKISLSLEEEDETRFNACSRSSLPAYISAYQKSITKKKRLNIIFDYIV